MRHRKRLVDIGGNFCEFAVSLCLRGWGGDTARTEPGIITENAMGDVVNLNRARKDRAKVDARATAAANRVSHGRTRGERTRAETERERAARLLDGSRLED